MKNDRNWGRVGLLVISFMIFVGLAGQLNALDENALNEDVVLANDYTQGTSFLSQFVIQGGPIVWFILMPLSFYACYQAIDLSIKINKKNLLPDDRCELYRKLAEKGTVDQLKTESAKSYDILSVSLNKAFSFTKKQTDRYASVHQVVAEVLQEKTLEILRQVEGLNLAGNISPMIGLFGTVFGMIKAFNTIVEAGGQPNASQLAGGISVALVTTFWGLFVAIPSLFIYGLLRNKLEVLASSASVEAEEILDMIEGL